VVDDLVSQLHARAAKATAPTDDPREFRARLVEFVGWLYAERRIGMSANALEESGFTLLDDFDLHQQAMAPRINDLRIELERHYPDAERPRAPKPLDDDRGEAALLWMFSLARFEELVTAIERGPTPPTVSRHAEEDSCQTDVLLKIMRCTINRLREAETGTTGRDDLLHELESKRAELAGEHQRIKQHLYDAVMAGAPCAVLRLRRLTSDDHLPGWPDASRRKQAWVTSVVEGRYGATAPLYLTEMRTMLAGSRKEVHDRDELFERVRDDLERVVLEVEGRTRELERSGGLRGRRVIGPVLRLLGDRSTPVWVSLVAPVVAVVITYVLATTHPFSGGEQTPWNTQVANICDKSNQRMASIVGESPPALTRQAKLSVETFFALDKLTPSSPPYQRVPFEEYMHDRWAIAKARLELARAAQHGQPTIAAIQKSLKTAQFEAGYDAQHADLAVCGQLPSLE
jgi:hypothetical protein